MIANPDDFTVELLLDSDSRRLSIEEHRTWRETLSQEHAVPVDPIDELIADIRHARKEEKQ